MNKYIVTRTRYVVESIVQFADNDVDAINASRKTLKKDWRIVDDKKRDNYSAKEV